MKRHPTPIADLMEREARFLCIAEIVWRRFKVQFTEQQKKQFLATGTFCPHRPAVEVQEDSRRRGGKRKESRR